MPAAIALTPAPAAPAGAGDATRRWALSFPDGRARFAGVSRPEGERAAPALAALAPADWELALVEVALPVILSEGAGPYMLDAEGRLTLALAPHPGLDGARIAMGQPSPGHRLGLVERLPAGGLWRWLCDAVVAPGERVAALDDLDRVDSPERAAGWRERWRREGR